MNANATAIPTTKSREELRTVARGIRTVAGLGGRMDSGGSSSLAAWGA